MTVCWLAGVKCILYCRRVIMWAYKCIYLFIFKRRGELVGAFRLQAQLLKFHTRNPVFGVRHTLFQQPPAGTPGLNTVRTWTNSPELHGCPSGDLDKFCVSSTMKLSSNLPLPWWSISQNWLWLHCASQWRTAVQNHRSRLIDLSYTESTAPRSSFRKIIHKPERGFVTLCYK